MARRCLSWRAGRALAAVRTAERAGSSTTSAINVQSRDHEEATSGKLNVYICLLCSTVTSSLQCCKGHLRWRVEEMYIYKRVGMCMG